MRRTLAVLGLCVLTAAPMRAQTVTLSGNGTVSAGNLAAFNASVGAAFSAGQVNFFSILPASPAVTPIDAATSSFAATFTFSQSATTQAVAGSMLIFTAAGGGGFRFHVIGLDAPVIFTGAVTAPTFASGVYTPTNNFGNPLKVQQFTIASSTVPEPSTYALMGAGLAALAIVARRRRV